MATILIVDDETITLMYLTEQLKSMGHEVIGKATSGPKAVEIARLLKPDLIFMDISMPGEYDGIEAAKIIEDEMNIPIIFLTAYSDEHYINAIKKIGPFGYIIKPFKESEIRVNIHIALYRSNMERKLNLAIEKYKNQIKNEKIIQQVLSRINTVFDPYDKLEEILNLVKDGIGLKYISIYILNESTNCLNKIMAAKNKDILIKDINKIDVNDFVDSFKDNFKIINLITNSNKLPEKYKEYAEKNNIKAILSLPLFVEDKYFGLILLYNFESKIFQNDILNFSKVIANAISLLLKRHYDFMKLKEAEEEKLLNERNYLRTERLASLGQLTSSIAHEINQPLQSIKILADSVIFWEKENKKIPYEKVIENFHKISERVSRVDRIIKNMRLMLKMPEKIEIKPININSLIIENYEFYTEKMERHKIDFKYFLDDKMKTLSFPDVQFQQIIVNLLENAINSLDKVERENKKITIETEDKNEYVNMAIIDNGIGIQDEIKEKIFDPFFSTYQKKDGMGMGLYVVSSILKTFNSTIVVTDSEEKGARFVIRFNRTQT
jgi:signal transduction histidine kinase/AmiR/NasT family two-component response regulator